MLIVEILGWVEVIDIAVIDLVTPTQLLTEIVFLPTIWTTIP